MMRRSFGGGRGGMSGGGSMFRAFRRTVRAGGEPFSHSTTTTTTTTNTTTTPSSPTNHKPSNLNILSVSSANNTNPFSLPICSTSGWPSSSPTDEFDQWEFIEDERATPLDYDDHFVFGCVPSLDEVQHAVSSLQQVLDPASFSQFIKDRVAYDPDNDAAEEVTSPTSFIHRRVPSVRSEVDWMEPPLQLYNSRMLNLHGSDRVYDAFHLLQTDPSVQRMVVALSSDKAVWDAVMNNEVVRELRESLDEDAAGNFDAMSSVSDDGYDDSEGTMDLLTWIFLNAKTKVMVLIDKITNMVDELLFIPPTAGSEKKREQATIEYSFDGKLGTCVLLSIVVFLTVVVTRATRA